MTIEPVSIRLFRILRELPVRGVCDGLPEGGDLGMVTVPETMRNFRPQGSPGVLREDDWRTTACITAQEEKESQDLLDSRRDGTITLQLPKDDVGVIALPKHVLKPRE